MGHDLGLVLILLPGPDLAGAERQALLFAGHLKKEVGAQVEVWGLSGGTGRAALLCQEQELPWRSLDLAWSNSRSGRLAAAAQLTHELVGARPRVLLPYTLLPNLLCGVAWRFSGARLCLWNQRDDGLTRVGPRLTALAARLTRFFSANSRPGAEYLVKDLGIDPGRVAIVRNGIQLGLPRETAAAWRARLGLGPGAFLACMVAHLRTLKDHATLLRAWRLVIDEMGSPTALLALAGRLHDTAEATKALAFDLDLGKSVRFLGEVDDIPGLLLASDLGIFCTRGGEGMPNGLLECMAAGLPVVGTQIAGIQEAVGPEGYPYLAPAGDARAIADRILAFSRDPALRLTVGRRNREHVQVEFSPEAMCHNMMAVITGGLAGRLPEALSFR